MRKHLLKLLSESTILSKFGMANENNNGLVVLLLAVFCNVLPSGKNVVFFRKRFHNSFCKHYALQMNSTKIVFGVFLHRLEIENHRQCLLFPMRSSILSKKSFKKLKIFISWYVRVRLIRKCVYKWQEILIFRTILHTH